MTEMNFAAVGAELAVLCLAMFVLAVDLIIPRNEPRRTVGYIALGGLTVIFGGVLGQYGMEGAEYFLPGMFVTDNYALLFKLLFIAATMGTIMFSLDYAAVFKRGEGEFYALLLFALTGMMAMSSANDFLTMFVSLEMMAVSFYILTGYRVGDAASAEAGVKYILVGSASTAVMLYGISFIYGSTGTLSFNEIYRLSLNLLQPMGMAGITMIMIGIFFKLSVMPFHMWAPDVYQGAPAPVSGLLAMGSKAAALALFMRVLCEAFPIAAGYWISLLAALSAICIIGGNLMALSQENVKRMLAYSSIAQVGYMLNGMVAADGAGMKGAIFYMSLYVVANIGAFAAVTFVERTEAGTDKSHFAGLSRRSPVLAAVMTVSLLSMAGVPPTAGFVGKLYLFSAVIERGYMWLALVGFVMSMISVYYYLQVVRAMYVLPENTEIIPVNISGAMRAVALISAVLTVLIGICPERLAAMANLAVNTFM